MVAYQQPQIQFANADYCGVSNDSARLDVLERYDPDSLDDDAELNALRQFAAGLCDAPIALVTLVEKDRQRFLSKQGLAVAETPRDVSFCQHAMQGHEVMVVPDTHENAQFKDNVLVTGSPYIRFYAGAPLVSDEGAPLGALCVISDSPREGLSELQNEGLLVLAQAVMRRLNARREELASTKGREEAKRLLEDSQQQFDNLADALPQMAWSTDGEGHVDYFNSRWYEFTGANEGDHHRSAWVEAVYEGDRERATKVWNEAVASGEPYEVEYRLRRHDGEYRWTLARGLPVKNARGEVLRWFGSNTDIHEFKQLAESQELLSRELSHRIKNIFSVVTGLVSYASRSYPEMKPVATSIGDRINALGRAHNYVRPMSDVPMGTICLSDILGDLFAPYQEEGKAERVRIEGGGIEIRENSITPFALVFHELATNSVKYGALSVDEGHVDLTIREEGDEIAMQWREVGGPAPAAPEDGERGFGSDLLETSLKRQLKGSVERRWPATGLEIDIRLPRERIVREG